MSATGRFCGIKGRKALPVLFFLALCAKYILYDFAYFPVLDDFIQYGGYPLYDQLGDVYFGIGTVAARPLAGFLDPALWGSMWEFMGLALAIITLLQFFTALLLEKTLSDNGVYTGAVLYLVFLLFPLGMEGSYWISASSRTVVGLFLASLALYFFSGFLRREGWCKVVLFAVFTLLSFGFYEAVTVFCVAGAVLLAAFNWKTARGRTAALIIPAAELLLLLGWYTAFSDLGAMGSRAAGFSLSGIFGRIGDFFSQLGYILFGGGFCVTVRGFAGGLQTLWENGIWGILLLIALLVLSFLIARADAWPGEPLLGNFSQNDSAGAASAGQQKGQGRVQRLFGRLKRSTRRRRLRKNIAQGTAAQRKVRAHAARVRPNKHYRSARSGRRDASWREGWEAGRAFGPRRWLLLFGTGAVLFFAPLVPNLLVADVWLTYRSLFVPLVGLALMAAPVLDLLFRRRAVRGLAVFVLTALFLVANINEYETYRKVSVWDTERASAVAQALDEEVLSGEKEAVVLLEEEPVLAQASYYKDHVKSVFGADWSLTGAVRALEHNIGIRTITPVLPGETWEAEGRQVLYMDGEGKVTQIPAEGE